MAAKNERKDTCWQTCTTQEGKHNLTQYLAHSEKYLHSQNNEIQSVNLTKIVM